MNNIWEVVKDTCRQYRIQIGERLAGYTHEQREARRERIQRWREAIRQWDNFEDTSSMGTIEYSEMRPFLSEDIREQIEDPNLFIYPGGRGSVRRHMLLDEIARLEQEWRLL